jgi:hypothetical protein
VFQIFHPARWIDDEGKHPAPFTNISRDVRARLHPDGALDLQPRPERRALVRRGLQVEAPRSRLCTHQPRSARGAEQLTLRFVGVASGDFRTIAREMGVPDGCIAVQAQAPPSAIRQVFRMVSQSAIRASQGRIAPGANAGFFSP